MKIYDVSLAIKEDMPVWPGQPRVKISRLSTVDKDKAMVSKLSFSSHTGTHVDAPAHFLKKGKAVDKLPLDKLIGPARVVDLRFVKREITAGDLAAILPKRDKRVLFKTKNSRFLLQPSFKSDYVYLSLRAAKYLVSQKIALVGIDYLGIEKKGNPGHPVHKTLLSHGIIIVEGLYLDKVPAGEYMLYCLPLNVVGSEAAPARVILVGR